MSSIRWLPLALVAAGCASAPPEGGTDLPFTALSDESAWSRIEGATPRLPAWARILAETLPATTAHQINLDHAQRTQNPLGPVLAAEIRWIVAEALRCEYAKRCAEADLVKAGVTADRLATLADVGAAPEADRAPLAFARKLTVDSASITDDEFAGLVASCGADDVVAIVHTTAYANFQDRILVALGLESDDEAALVPQEVRPPAPKSLAAPPRTSPAELETGLSVDDSALPPWSERTFAELRERLAQQKARTTRLPDPDATRLARLPRPLRPRMGRIAWGTVSRGYQPELTKAWFRTMDTFEAEADLDQVFASSVFWVVNRATDCFYCMGHTEMLLEVGGLTADGVEERAARLASGDWSSFSRAEQEAFRYARKMTVEPWTVTRADVDALVATFGRERALDVVWYVAWGNYMMRISNAFQLRLEPTNVFAEQAKPAGK